VRSRNKSFLLAIIFLTAPSMFPSIFDYVEVIPLSVLWFFAFASGFDGRALTYCVGYSTIYYLLVRFVTKRISLMPMETQKIANVTIVLFLMILSLFPIFGTWGTNGGESERTNLFIFYFRLFTGKIF